MELLGVIAGLEALKEPCNAMIFTDSNYVVETVEKGWLGRWRDRGWRTADKKPVKNVDLWVQFLSLAEHHSLRMEWIRGHAGHPENERCDALASAAARGQRLLVDQHYETVHGPLP